MANAILSAIVDLARLRRIDLRPGWSDSAGNPGRETEAALGLCCEAIGWAPPVPYADNPRAHEFPLLVFHPDHGWGVAERIESENSLRVVRNGIATVWKDADRARLYDLVIPLPASQKKFDRAIDVFKAAIWRRKHVYVIAIVATFVVNIIALSTALYAMQVYDRVVPRGAFATLWVLAVGVIVALLFDFVLRVLRALLLEKEALAIDTEVSEFFFSRAADVRLDARPPSVGTMAAQLRGLEQIRAAFSTSTLFVFTDLPFALLFIVVIAAVGGVIALVMAAAFPIAILLALGFARMIRNDTGRANISGNRKNGLLVEAMDASETVKANRGHWFLLSRWNGLLDELHDAELPVKRLQAMASSVFGTLQQISYVCLVAWGAYEVVNNRITMGALIACSIIAGRVNGPLIAQLPGLLVQWSYARSSLAMLDALMQLPQERAEGVDQLRPNRLAPNIEFRDVQFAYPGGRSGISIPRLEISAGERIGIVGPVGSGKSTLLKVMSGLYAPASGQILIDRLDMSQVADDVLRHHIGYLPQDYRLVNGTLRDNIVLGLSDPGDEAIMAAAEKTGLAHLIAGHPRGLDLEISEGGRGLSGGQRVLTGLTRLLLARPRLLLLDEPTSNLDVETETRVLRALKEGFGADTALVLVTHKMQLVGLVNRLIVFGNGQVMLDGPTAEVVQRLRRPAGQPPAAAGAVAASAGANG